LIPSIDLRCITNCTAPWIRVIAELARERTMSWLEPAPAGSTMKAHVERARPAARSATGSRTSPSTSARPSSKRATGLWGAYRHMRTTSAPIASGSWNCGRIRRALWTSQPRRFSSSSASVDPHRATWGSATRT
jgi:hypothetical protein